MDEIPPLEIRAAGFTWCLGRLCFSSFLAFAFILALAHGWCGFLAGVQGFSLFFFFFFFSSPINKRAISL
ncbi:hypothetical protein VN97_g2754 [Penicillium thymicola]|uniref:Transmembrane protein n=1 Tax=Penicillium thymicola TaxID=293382 RepID=A0AAI9TNZ6_PENTH|nr:hypothetical protein VN97_g2754 [Penicillium thymicola]